MVKFNCICTLFQSCKVYCLIIFGAFYHTQCAAVFCGPIIDLSKAQDRAALNSRSRERKGIKLYGASQRHIYSVTEHGRICFTVIVIHIFCRSRIIFIIAFRCMGAVAVILCKQCFIGHIEYTLIPICIYTQIIPSAAVRCNAFCAKGIIQPCRVNSVPFAVNIHLAPAMAPAVHGYGLEPGKIAQVGKCTHIACAYTGLIHNCTICCLVVIGFGVGHCIGKGVTDEFFTLDIGGEGTDTLGKLIDRSVIFHNGILQRRNIGESGLDRTHINIIFEIGVRCTVIALIRLYKEILRVGIYKRGHQEAWS